MSFTQALPSILQLAGAGVTAYGQNKADQQNYARKEELELFEEQLQETYGPLLEGTLAGFAPGGFLRGVYAAPGLERAASAGYERGFLARRGGSRTGGSARAALAGAPAAETLAREDAAWAGEREGSKRMAEADLLLRALAMPQTAGAVNQLAGYGEALQSLGTTLRKLDSK
jgi:hypothetical protein